MFLVRFVCVVLIRFYFEGRRNRFAPLTKKDATAKVMPHSGVILAKSLLLNKLHIKIILVLIHALAIPDQREQKCLTNS